VRDLWEGEVGGDVVEEETAVCLADLDLLVLSEVVEGIRDDLGVVLVDDAVAGVVGSEDD